MMSMTKTQCGFVCNWCQPRSTIASGIMAITYALLSLQLGKKKKFTAHQPYLYAFIIWIHMHLAVVICKKFQSQKNQ